MFIDQLEMIHEKTRGNLTTEEAEILTRVLSDLQLSFVQVAGSAPEAAQPVVADASEEPDAPAATTAPEPPSDPAPEAENRKKFTKSYGN